MMVKERVLISRLIEKLYDNRDYCQKIGIEFERSSDLKKSGKSKTQIS
jgi:hypothetical protein